MKPNRVTATVEITSIRSDLIEEFYDLFIYTAEIFSCPEDATAIKNKSEKYVTHYCFEGKHTKIKLNRLT